MLTYDIEGNIFINSPPTVHYVMRNPSLQYLVWFCVNICYIFYIVFSVFELVLLFCTLNLCCVRLPHCNKIYLFTYLLIYLLTYMKGTEICVPYVILQM